MGGDPHQETQRVCLGIEGGGTRTVALLADARGCVLGQLSLGPLNLKLSTDAQILRTLRRIRHSSVPLRSALYAPRCSLHGIAVCLAGCRTAADRARVRALTGSVFPNARCVVGSDLDSGFAAAFGMSEAGILVISGTGSCVVGRNECGQMARAGGWGRLLGDHGSGYWIAITGLRNAIRDYDRNGRISPSLRKTLTRLCLNTPDQLIDWIAVATKGEVAALASIFLHRNSGLLLQAASFLAMDCEAVAGKLHLETPRVALAGGVLQNNRDLRKWVTHRIRTIFPRARIFRPKLESAHGALLLAQDIAAAKPFRSSLAENEIRNYNDRDLAHVITEQRNPRTMDLDRRSIAQLIDTMLGEEARVIPALRADKRAIERAIRTIVAAFKRSGRLFYVGAGTSGRLGVLDATECPPTFSTDPQMVQAIIAGGAPALHSAVELTEDDPLTGAEAIRNRGVGKRDVVVGIAASGSTPFVLGALDEAKRLGARTFLLCFSAPRSSLHAPLFFPTGPEILTGSTRLKAGTATKLVLNMLTTISMIRLGKVVGNLMVDVKPTNEKLRARACRIIATLRNCSEEEARQRLTRACWNVKRALSRP
jgi:N-acetylmuramic acid 6-phosphate etherase